MLPTRCTARHLTRALGALAVAALMLTTPAMASTPSDRPHPAPHARDRASKPALLAPARRHEAHGRHRPCRNHLVHVLRHAGFRGQDLREAWAIAMRESHGKPGVISRTHDYGLFQLNAATYSAQRWWDGQRLLRPRYNARAAYRLSQGGRTWAPWGLDGHGRARAHVYRSAGWSKSQVRSWIVRPYRHYRAAYPC